MCMQMHLTFTFTLLSREAKITAHGTLRTARESKRCGNRSKKLQV